MTPTNPSSLLSTEQFAIVDDLCRSHGLEPAQISFDGDGLTPIFDYVAVSALSLKLTDIKDLTLEITNRDDASRFVSVARCTVTLPDGRSRTVEDSAEVGELIHGDETVTTLRDADGMAQNRAARRGIRSVGIDLWRAHRQWKDTGSAAAGRDDFDPRKNLGREIHALSDEIGYARDDYEAIIAENFDGRVSTSELTEEELTRFATLLRAIRRIQKSRSNR